MIAVCVEWLDEMKFFVDVQLLCLCFDILFDVCYVTWCFFNAPF